MVTTAQAIRDWVESTRPTDWYGMCAGLTDRVVAAFTDGSRQWYDSATDARNASGWLNPDASACPPGGIHYWSYYGTAWDGSQGDWGHVTIDIHGGGGSTLSATGFAYENWGVRAGLISVESQSSRAGMKYLGWAPTYGNASPLIIKENTDMPLDANADYPAFLHMLQRAFRYDLRPNGAGADWKNGPTVWERFDGVERAAAQKITDAQVKAIADAVVKSIGQPTVSVDYVAIAKTVRSEFASNPLK